MEGIILSLKYLSSIAVFLLHINYGVGDYNNIRCIEGERQALLGFKNSLSVESQWLSSWGDEEEKKECCKWRGVECSNSTGHVVKLDLRAYDLRGKISPSLKGLHHLEHLDLSYNHLDEVENLMWLSHLSNLQYLDLSGGLDLYEAHGWLSVIDGLIGKLSTLKLHKCHLPPPTLNNQSPLFISNVSTSSLVTLDLSGNYLSKSSSSTLFQWLLKSSATLVFLDLSSNGILGYIPSTFGSMMALRYLDLSGNQLNGLNPESFRNLCHLRSLNLSGNFLGVSSLRPLDFFHNFSICANNSALQILKLDSNGFFGPLPDLSLFSALKELYLSDNHFSWNMTERNIGNLFELEVLDLSRNRLEGLIPEVQLSNFSKLRILDLSSNTFALKHISNWVPSFHLQVLKLRSCRLGPHFPNWLATQKNLSYLDLSYNEISDGIGKWLEDFNPNMLHMNLSNNQIHVELPNLSATFPSLVTLDLSFNSLHDSLPPFPTNLTFLNLSNNSISGSIQIPPFLKGCKKLELLDLSNNKMVEIPMSLRGCEKLKLVDLSNNKIGEIPTSFNGFEKLKLLDLSNNKIGEIPTSFNGFEKLKLLALSNNNIVDIPTSLEGLERLEVLDLSSNKIVETPMFLKGCVKLKLLDLSSNRISGEVPAWIGQSLLELNILILRSNEFTGSFPLSLCTLTSLRILDLAQNGVSGTIPQCLNKTSAVTSFGNSGGTHHADELVYNFLNPVPENMVYESGLYLKYKDKVFVVGEVTLAMIDFSGNKLTGNFPKELSTLSGLHVLNLSGNYLSGELPKSLGELKDLEVLDLSHNGFSGGIPTSLTNLSFLSYLNLSYNNFSGTIPQGGQIFSFPMSSFIGNPALCGYPESVGCLVDPNFNETRQIHEDDGDDVKIWFYVGMGMGFYIGFWGTFGSLCLIHTWRHAYFKFLYKVKDWVLLRLALCTARLKRMLNTNKNH